MRISYGLCTAHMAGHNEVKLLFDLSVEAIFKHHQQLGKASLYLPQKISHYLLYLACCTKQFDAVERIVQHWPHPELCFNFYSNSLCRLKYKGNENGCLEAYEYFNFCTEELSSCIPSVAIGLFWNMTKERDLRGVENQRLRLSKAKLEVVDLTSVRVTKESNVKCLLELSQGNFPVKHPADYLTNRDVQVYQTKKPNIQPLPKSLKLPRLRVTIAITSSAILKTIVNIQAPGSRSCFSLEVTGIDLIFLPNKQVPHALRSLNDFAFPLENLFVHLSDLSTFAELTSEELSTLPLSPSTSLWLSTPTSSKLERHVVSSASCDCVFTQITKPTSKLKGLVITSDDSNVLSVMSSDVTLTISAFCMLRSNEVAQLDLNDLTKEVLQTFIAKNSKQLEYFQIRGCYLSMLPMDSLKLCTNLRVLSVTQYNTRGNRPINIVSNPSDIFRAISCISTLEYFDWAETLNFRTPDLLVFHRMLSDYLPRLQHCHMRLFQVLLSTTDLDCVDYKPINDLLLSLLKGRHGDEWISTYKFSLTISKFRDWMKVVRSDVCFELNVVSQSSCHAVIPTFF